MIEDNQINWSRVASAWNSLNREKPGAFVKLIMSGREEDLQKAISLREYLPDFFLQNEEPVKWTATTIAILCCDELGDPKPIAEIRQMMARLSVPTTEMEVPLKHPSKRWRQFHNIHFKPEGGQLKRGEDEDFWDWRRRNRRDGPKTESWFVLHSSVDELFERRPGRPTKHFAKTEKLLLVSFKHLAKEK